MCGDRLRVSTAVRSSISSDGLLLLDLRGGLVLASNPIGARIWHLLEQQCARGDIARQIADEYGVAIERVERDVATFVETLVSRGLVLVEPK
jgi:hypothetical protein